jgi:hypothetical protein
LCVYVLNFLDAELKGDETGKAFLANQYRDTKLTDAAPHVESVPDGRTSPDPYQEDSSQPPTPRQLRYFLNDQGSEKTMGVLRRFRKEALAQPIDHPIFGFALVADLLEQGKSHDAFAFRDYYRESGIDCAKMLSDWGRTYMRLDRKAFAAYCFKKVLLLEPSNAEAADRLKELGDSNR